VEADETDRQFICHFQAVGLTTNHGAVYSGVDED
jgi:hypothetical protein